MLAAKFGCTLTQDLLFHEQSSGRWAEAHEVYALDNVKHKFKVNSHHHQALTLNNCTDNIIPIMLAINNDSYITGDQQIVESFKVKDSPIYGIQWHPEELYDYYTVELLKRLTK
jgi:gamma-glutamyl-gamma-aminobutyrate hydrolase PuuD